MAELRLQLTWAQGLLSLLQTDVITMEPGTKLPFSETGSKVSAHPDGRMLVSVIGIGVFPKPAVFIYFSFLGTLEFCSNRNPLFSLELEHSTHILLEEHYNSMCVCFPNALFNIKC